mgnify:CR=1 FL=1
MKAVLVAVVVAVAVFALAGVTADTAQAAPTQQIQGYHVVRPGETLFCIGRCSASTKSERSSRVLRPYFAGVSGRHDLVTSHCRRRQQAPG